MDDKEKILLVFDLDHTILDKNSDREISTLFKIFDESIYNRDHKQQYWGDVMQKVYIQMKKEGIEIEQIKELIQSLTLTKNFNDLFDFIRINKNKFECIIISGANTLFIKWLIEKHKWDDIFSDFYSNPAEICVEKLISIKNFHSHQCSNGCDGSQCKKIILADYLQMKNNIYKNIVYLGDGSNDYCPSTLLNLNDTLYPRKNFDLFKDLYSLNKIINVKCNVVPWENGLDIIDSLKNFYQI